MITLLNQIIVFQYWKNISSVFRAGYNGTATNSMHSGVTKVCCMAFGDGVHTDSKQAIELEKEVMMAAWKGLDPYNMLTPKAASGTREDPNKLGSLLSPTNE